MVNSSFYHASAVAPERVRPVSEAIGGDRFADSGGEPQVIVEIVDRVEPGTEDLVYALQKGDEVVTAGGILGRISKIGDQYVTVEVADKTELTVQRGAIAQLLPKGTIKAL